MDQALSPRIIRRLVWLIFVGGIAGMIVGSIKDSNGFAITSGLITAVAAVGLILITSVAPPGSLAKPEKHDDEGVDDEARPPDIDEEVAADVEARIQALVDAGADEEDLRKLVRRAIDLRPQRH